MFTKCHQLVGAKPPRPPPGALPWTPLGAWPQTPIPALPLQMTFRCLWYCRLAAAILLLKLLLLLQLTTSAKEDM